MDAGFAALSGALIAAFATLSVAVVVARWQRREARTARSYATSHNAVVAFIQAAQGCEQSAMHPFYSDAHARHPEADQRIEALWAAQNVLEVVTTLEGVRHASRQYADGLHRANFEPDDLDGEAPWVWLREVRDAFFRAARTELGGSDPR